MGPVSPGYPRPAVWRPTTLPEWIEAEPQYEIRPALGAMTPCPDAGDKTGAHVDPRRDAHAKPGFDTRCAGNDGV
jgi:hypothetical protein